MEDYSEGIILLFFLEEYIIKIQKWYIKILLKKQKNQIYNLFKTFEERIYKERENILTKYEVAWDLIKQIVKVQENLINK